MLSLHEDFLQSHIRSSLHPCLAPCSLLQQLILFIVAADPLGETTEEVVEMSKAELEVRETHE